MRSVDVVMPSRRREHAFVALSHLRFIPWPIRLHLVIEEQQSWSKAVNLGLDETLGDVILMDDDVFIGPETFALVDKYYDKADIFGFKLKFPDGKIQHAGGVFRGGNMAHLGMGEDDRGQHNQPKYTCHLTTSLVYIKRKVLEKLMGMSEDYPGLQFEDVDFSFRALAEGARLLYLPGEATHLQSASKSSMPRFHERVAENYAILKERWLDRKEWLDIIEAYPKQLAEVIQP